LLVPKNNLFLHLGFEFQDDLMNVQPKANQELELHI
jgi:hypothetical protein